MSKLKFDPDNTLAGGLYAMTAREAVALGIRLCDAVEDAVGTGGSHLGVWPGNITSADGQLALGPANAAGRADMDGELMEYAAPELFWSGKGTAASDVYSIGLVLYTALNRGVRPYFSSAGDEDPDARAKALERRMRGEALPYPISAGQELSEVVLKALSYEASARYATPALLRAALEALPEGGYLPAAHPDGAEKTVPSYKVDKDFDRMAQKKTKAGTKPKPGASAKAKKAAPRKQRTADEVDERMSAEKFRGEKTEAAGASRWLVPVLLVVVAIILILILRSCGESQARQPVNIETEPPAPPETEQAIRPPVPETSEVPETEPPEETPAPEETEPPEETEEPPETEPPEETGHDWSSVTLADVTWTQARAICEAQGGHLAVVRSEADLQEVIAMANEAGAQFVWLGSYRDTTDNVWLNVTGDRMNYAVWDTGEPSGGAGEDYLLLWNRPKVAADYWRYNDQINDPVTLLPGSYAGKIGYICEFD